MQVSVTGDPGVMWLLPLAPRELAGALELMAVTMAPASGSKPGAVDLALLDDAGMAALNKNFLGLAGPTNILAFPASGPEETASLALSARTVCREAWLYGQNAETYTLRMLAHGLAHLLGHEHGPKMDLAVERAVEAALRPEDGSAK